MSDKIYIVTSGCYSETEIVGAYTTEEAAEIAKSQAGEDGYVVEMEMNQIPQHEPGKKFYRVYMDKDGNVEMEPSHLSIFGSDGKIEDSQFRHSDGKFVFNMWARDEVEAVKIANEKRAMMIALPFV